MKRVYIIAFFCSLCTVCSMAQQKSIFDELSEMKGVTSMYISKAMFQLMPNMKTDELNLTPYIQKLESVQILSSETAEAVAKMRKALSYITPQNGYEELMRVTEDGEKTVICWKQGTHGVNEFVLLNDEGKEYSAIIILGRLTLEEMQKIAKK